ncbi:MULTISPECIES: bifunctional chorismate mutase/prephenate dehydratase [unclassified Helicobacter]|uniref:bifunctional chorismate mutase/prephenate dehydratase n=1 Tax=unclassified Helicobacter TaxID=2593540 RepID=UPI000CF12AA1|nr:MULTISPECIES: bifunctional chorismate mutase/prephenate dehydratase [unclassified Helicobacter]
MNHEISILREEIDKIDDDILALLEKRMECAQNIGRIKALQNSTIYVPEREKSILLRLQQKNTRFLSPQAIQTIYQEIFAVSRSLESLEKVAFLGSIGDFAHQALEKRFKVTNNCLAMNNIESVFEALKSQRVKYGLIPLESQDGITGESIKLLLQNNFKIIAEIFLPTHYCLMGDMDNLQEIKKIYSKDNAFKQCKKFLQSHHLDLVQKVSVDTFSKAGYLVSGEKNTVAICPKITAKYCNIPVILEDIEDSCNEERFIIVSDFSNQSTSNDKTSVFVVCENQDKTENLLKLLSDFSKYQINITSIALKRIDMDFKTGFYIDFDGHYDDFNVQKLFKESQMQIKWLGSYIKEK